MKDIVARVKYYKSTYFERIAEEYKRISAPINDPDWREACNLIREHSPRYFDRDGATSFQGKHGRVYDISNSICKSIAEGADIFFERASTEYQKEINTWRTNTIKKVEAVCLDAIIDNEFNCSAYIDTTYNGSSFESIKKKYHLESS